MITYHERNELGKKPLPKGVLGYDCDGKHLKISDKVEVVTEEKDRKGDPEFYYCVSGKSGVVIYDGPGGDSNWIVIVQFPTENEKKETAGCVDYYLRKIS